ncbi:hypothetical protein ACQ4PT_003529 [Festuca glaucescens]
MFYNPILHAANQSLSNKKYADFHADLASDRSSSGLPRVGANVASAAALSADSQQHSRRSWGGAADSVGRQQLGQSEATAAVVAASGASPLVETLQQAAVKDAGPRLANGVQEHEKLVGSAGDQRRSGIASEAGSFVAMQKDSRPLLVSSQAQKIRPAHEAATAAVHGDSANHWAPDEPMMGPGLDDQGGLSAHGPCLDPIMVGPFEKHMEDAMGSALSEKKGEKSTVDLQGRMRNASFMKNTELSIYLQYSFSLLLEQCEVEPEAAEARVWAPFSLAFQPDLGDVHSEIFAHALQLVQEALDALIQLLPHRCDQAFLVFLELAPEVVRDVAL